MRDFMAFMAWIAVVTLLCAVFILGLGCRRVATTDLVPVVGDSISEQDRQVVYVVAKCEADVKPFDIRVEYSKEGSSIYYFMVRQQCGSGRQEVLAYLCTITDPGSVLYLSAKPRVSGQEQYGFGSELELTPGMGPAVVFYTSPRFTGREAFLNSGTGSILTADNWSSTGLPWPGTRQFSDVPDSAGSSVTGVDCRFSRSSE